MLTRRVLALRRRFVEGWTELPCWTGEMIGGECDDSQEEVETVIYFLLLFEFRCGEPGTVINIRTWVMDRGGYCGE
jgi:hypothetical protein